MSAKVDRRDLILTTLFNLLKGLTVTLTNGTIPAGHIVRNRDELPKELVPGIILLDADEVRDPRTPLLQGRATRVSPSLMRMTPEIYVVLDVRKPQNALVGEDINLARAAIINAIVHNKDLLSIVGDNGSIVYDGCVTDLARNRQMRGQLGISITFTYPFIPDEFVGA